MNSIIETVENKIKPKGGKVSDSVGWLNGNYLGGFYRAEVGVGFCSPVAVVSLFLQSFTFTL